MGREDRSPVNPVALVRDAAGSAAVDLAKIRDAGHVSLAKAADKAGIALSKRDLSGIRAQAACVLDHSGSMSGDYKSGAVQALVERVLGFSLQIDVDGSVPVIAFDHRIHPAVDVTVANYSGVVDRQIWRPRDMGTTNLAAALEVVRDMAAKTPAPLYVSVVTDGEPDDPHAATRVVCDLARYPVFLKFLAVRPVAYLAKLDKLDGSKRLLDNCNAKPELKGSGASLSLLACSELEFQDAMADEWDQWILRAKAAGVLL
jgi:hypothetical protein